MSNVFLMCKSEKNKRRDEKDTGHIYKGAVGIN